MTDEQFIALMDTFLSTDDNPLYKSNIIVDELLNQEALKRGYHDWGKAYRMMENDK